MALQIRNAQISDLNGSKLTDSSVSLSKLASSNVTIGSTSISLGGTSTTLAGLSSVTSSAFSGALTGDVTGDLTGDVTGDVTGNLTGNVVHSDGTVLVNTTAKSLYLTGNDTDDLSEGSTNKYYANSLVDLHLSGGTGVSYSSGEISIGQAVATDSNVTFQNLTLSGNLTVSGSTTTVNSNEVNIGDAIILLNSDETGTPSQNAGIEVERGTSTNKSFIWDEASDRWSAGASDSIYAGGGFSGNLTGNVTGDVTGDLTGDVTGDVTGNLTGNVVTSDATILVNATTKEVNFINKDTGDLAEGSNQYFTNARADARIAAASIGDVTDVVLASTKEAGDMLLWDGTDYVNVKMVADSHTIGASPGNSITLNFTSDSDFYHMAQVYLNGQHMRFSDDNTLDADEDYHFSAANEITFSSGLIAQGDHIQVILYVKQS